MIAHIVLNSHLDPIWRWKREQGICEVLATAYSACGILDDYPEAVITRGEAWFYEIVEEMDPALFKRIRDYVESGRWRIVGNWYVQPDCNLASPESYLKHGEIAGKYFRDKFGVQVKTGYNVDSFGHGAILPSFYRSCGVENYIVSRPGKLEMDLPANDFIWRAADGAEVTVSRILDGYQTWPDGVDGHTQRVLDAANPELGHVLLMFGCGNHGCGPFRFELDWLMAHRNDYPGVEFRFSHPDAYFEAVKNSGVKLPVVTGELQHHAVGCYSIVSRIKRELRSAENALIQRGHYLPAEKQETLWKKVLFSTFHDVLPGSSILTAYQDVYDDLGVVRSEINNAAVSAIRKENIKLAECSFQRLIFDNPGGEDFSGIVEFEPWFSLLFKQEVLAKGAGMKLCDENGNPVTFQFLKSEAGANSPLSIHLALHLDIPAGGRRILTAQHDAAAEAVPQGELSTDELKRGDITVKCSQQGIAAISKGGVEFLAAPIEFQKYEDLSDTWSHFQNSYENPVKECFVCTTPWREEFCGPVVTALLSQWYDSDRNRIKLLARTEEGTNGLQMMMRVNWHGDRELLKVAFKPAFQVEKWIGGCPGGTVERPANGKEYPVFNQLTLCGKNHSLTLVSPDIYSADLRPDGTLRLTLLRSTAYAFSADSGSFDLPDMHLWNMTDQGELDFRLLLLPDADEAEISRAVYCFTEPVKYSEVTRGICREGHDPRNFVDDGKTGWCASHAEVRD